MVFWYNIESGQVEPDESKSQSADLMGPYDTEEQARNALQTAAEKTAAWDEEDRAYEEEGFES
jgi:hypothetical protein